METMISVIRISIVLKIGILSKIFCRKSDVALFRHLIFYCTSDIISPAASSEGVYP